MKRWTDRRSIRPLLLLLLEKSGEADRLANGQAHYQWRVFDRQSRFELLALWLRFPADRLTDRPSLPLQREGLVNYFE